MSIGDWVAVIGLALACAGYLIHVGEIKAEWTSFRDSVLWRLGRIEQALGLPAPPSPPPRVRGFSAAREDAAARREL